MTSAHHSMRGLQATSRHLACCLEGPVHHVGPEAGTAEVHGLPHTASAITVRMYGCVGHGSGQVLPDA